jgi:cell division inhibitor SulA
MNAAAASMSPAQAWRARRAAGDAGTVPTGYSELDALLPGGGWPRGAVTEIGVARQSVGALRLLLPVLAQLSHEDRWLCWVAPPHVPSSPALVTAGIDVSRVLLVHPGARQDGLWAVEQSLRVGTCGAVLAWPTVDDPGVIHRLQLAARAGDCLGFMFRPLQFATRPSAAALRIRLDAHSDGNLSVSLLRRRGGQPAGTVHLDTVLSHQGPGVPVPGTTGSGLFSPNWQ